MKTIYLPPGEGRSYPIGRISAVFKADGDEKDMPAIARWFAENPPQDARL